MTIEELRKAIENEQPEDEISVGLDVEGSAIVASLSVYRPHEDEVIDILTEEYRIMGFSTERKAI